MLLANLKLNKLNKTEDWTYKIQSLFYFELLFTIYIPIHTRIRAAAFFKSRILSPKNIEDNMAPDIGIMKLNIDIELTLLYFKSNVQSEKATAESKARYSKIIVDGNVKLVMYPLLNVPIIIRKIPPINSWYPVTSITSIVSESFLL